MPHTARSSLRTWCSGLFTGAMALFAVCACVAHANEPCTTEPNVKAVQGSHWYYRLDRVNQRKCWFLARAGMKVEPPGSARAQSAPRPPQSAANTPDGHAITRNGRSPPDQPIAVAPNPGAAPSAAVVPRSVSEPEADAQPEASFTAEAPSVWPVLARSESEAAESPTSLPVEPAHLLALLAAALGVAAVAARLIFSYSGLRTQSADRHTAAGRPGRLHSVEQDAARPSVATGSHR
jgi:hypothetical protein